MTFNQLFTHLLIMLKAIHFFLILITLLSWSFVQAKPYLPNNPEQLLEKLPNTLQAKSPIAQLRIQLNRNPNDELLATKLAKLYIEQARQEGDPRYLGYAQAALSPWWKLTNPPLEVMVLRATLLQSNHHFDQALIDLNAVLKQNPENGQAWITKATILQVQGKYPEALDSCKQLSNLAPNLITLTCISNVLHLSGKSAQSYADLKTAYAQNIDKTTGIDIWVMTLLAEMAHRLGDDEAAEHYFLASIQLEEPDSYLLGAYSDFLLDKKRPQQVIKLLKDKTKVDPLLLRYVEALKLILSDQTDKYIQTLKLTFAAAELRGDTVHQREQSRFELRLMNNPKRALILAKENWKVQKEPADARVYLEAAIAMNDKQSIKVIKEWLTSNQQIDTNLSHLMGNQ